MTPVKRAIMCAVLNTLYSIRHVISCVAFGNISMMYNFMHTHMYMLGKTSLLIIIRAGQSLEVSPKGQVLNQSQVCVNPWALGEVLVSGSWAYLLCWKLLTSEYSVCDNTLLRVKRPKWCHVLGNCWPFCSMFAEYYHNLVWQRFHKAVLLISSCIRREIQTLFDKDPWTFATNVFWSQYQVFYISTWWVNARKT